METQKREKVSSKRFGERGEIASQSHNFLFGANLSPSPVKFRISDIYLEFSMTAATSATVDVNRLLNSSFKWSSINLADIQFSDDEEIKPDIPEASDSNIDFTNDLRKVQNIDLKSDEPQPSSSSANEDQTLEDSKARVIRRRRKAKSPRNPVKVGFQEENSRISDILKHKNPYIA